MTCSGDATFEFKPFLIFQKLLQKRYYYFEIHRALTLLYKKTKTTYPTEFYLIDFSSMDFVALEIQINVYIIYVGFGNKYLGLKGVGKLVRKIIDAKNDKLN